MATKNDGVNYIYGPIKMKNVFNIALFKRRQASKWHARFRKSFMSIYIYMPMCLYMST